MLYFRHPAVIHATKVLHEKSITTLYFIARYIFKNIKQLSIPRAIVRNEYEIFRENY